MTASPQSELLVGKRFLQAALDALDTHIAILDERSTIVKVNAAWRRFAGENGFLSQAQGVGENYLKICDAASGESSRSASMMAAGIRAVLAGISSAFQMEYSCHSPQEQRWFIARVTRFSCGDLVRVVIAHENITQRKKAEAALESSEERLRLALKAGGLGAFEHVISENRVLASPELCQMLELPGKLSIWHEEWIERMHPEDRDRVVAGVQRMLAMEIPLAVEYQLQLPSGNARWIRAMASPVVGSGKVERVYGVVQDITERILSESELRKLSRAVEQSPVSIMITDREGDIDYVNPKFCAVTGYSFEEVRGWNPRLLKSGVTPMEVHRQLWATITGGNQWQGEFQNRKKNGERYWESASISPVRDDQGKVTHFVAVKEDITARKETEERVAEALAYSQLLLDTAPVGIITFRATGEVVSANASAARMVGSTLEQLLEQNFRNVESWKRSGLFAAADAALATGQMQELEVHHVSTYGRDLWISAQFVPFDHQGQPGLLSMFVDHTERKRAARELAEQKENVERSRRALAHERELNQIKSRFVSMVSHEFRTPLGIVNSAAFLLGRYAEQMAPEEHAEHTQEIQRAVARMAQMMEDLLLQGKLEAGKLACNPARVDLEKLCASVIAEESGPDDAPGAIACSIEPDARFACLDEKIVRHVLGNLLSNAVKYSQPGQPVALDVRRVSRDALACRDTQVVAGDYIELKVSDSGIGIPAEDLPKLGQTFHRASNVSNRPGTGMGLAIVRQCVELHRGAIRFESQEGRGATVWVWLPTAHAALPERLKEEVII